MIFGAEKMNEKFLQRMQQSLSQTTLPLPVISATGPIIPNSLSLEISTALTFAAPNVTSSIDLDFRGCGEC
jgi:hypothetical protein